MTTPYYRPMQSALVVVPTYDERENVQPLSAAILAAAPRAHVLFVDDHSPDGTGELLDELAQDPRIHVLHRRDKQGLGRAYIAGFQWALEREYGFVLEMDADFSHNPADVVRLLDLAQDADLVLGSRYLGGVRVINWPLNRLILSKSAGLYVRLITGMPFTDPTGGFKCFRRAVLEELKLDRITSNGYSFQIEMTHQAWMLGFRIADLPITFEERRSGQSKMNKAIVREALWMVWKLALRARGRRSPRHAPHPRSVAANQEPTP
jgi:dolichol-phosphate mannosyltransferase